jgi:Kdo2-lipid IVA lauroyltransferase/acyltransferase
MNDDIIYRLLKIFIALLGRLPQWILNFFSDLLGLIWYKLDKRHRDLAIENINSSFPGKFSPLKSELLVKKVFKNTASILFEAIWSYHKTGNELFQFFTFKGMNYLDDARQKGRGVVLLTCHLGNFELLVGAIPMAGIKNVFGIYRKFDFKPLERLMLEIRQRFGVKMISTGGLSKKIDKLLNSNKIIGTLFDQNAGTYNGVFVDFFSRPACTKNSLAKIVLRTKASVVPMFIMKKNDRYIIEFLQEIPLEKTGCPIKDIENNTQHYVSAVESMIRRCPEQYFWVHNRWKTKPYSMIVNHKD